MNTQDKIKELINQYSEMSTTLIYGNTIKKDLQRLLEPEVCDKQIELENLILLCLNDLFSPSCKFTKLTALALCKYKQREGIIIK